MATVLEIVDAFDKRQFSKVEQFLQNIVAARGISNETITQPAETKQTKIDQAFPYLNDIGNGPIVTGLGALQVMSDVIGGANLSGVKMFNRYNIKYSPYELKNADENFSIIIILENLGMFNYYNTAKNVNTIESNKLKDLCILMSRRIKAGAFVKFEFLSRVLVACKSVIRVTINYRQVI